MMNKLPEKLTLLRKHFGLSQGDISSRLSIPLTEYLNWENGNSIPKIRQLKQIADLYHLDLDVLVDNSKTIVIPSLDAGADSVQSPFANHSADRTQDLTVDMTEDILPLDRRTQTRPIQTVREPVSSNTSALQQTLVTQIVEDEPEYSAQQDEDGENGDKKKMTAMILGFTGAAVVLIILALLFLRGCDSGGSVNRVTEINRLALGDTYSLFVNNDERLTVHGSFSPASEFKKPVQVSAYDGHALGLNGDGTVSSSDGNETVASWTDIVMAAAGRTHSVGLTKEGTVVCAGSQAACAVEGWSDIKSVYAGNAVTIGLNSAGQVLVSGSEAESLQGTTGIASAAIGETQILLVGLDGNVRSYALGSTPASDTSGWRNIVQAAAGSDYAAGLDQDGRVQIITDDPAMEKAVGSWTNIRYIAGKGDTLIAYDRSGKMYGFGTNTSDRYEDNTVIEEDPEEDDKTEQLAAVTNIKFTETTGNIQVKWTEVRHADYYKVEFEPALSSTLPDAANTSASIPASQLTNGQTYTVTITAYANDDDKYKASEPTSISYTYNAKTIQLSSPSNIHAQSVPYGWYISWDGVDNADYYILNVDGALEDRTAAINYTMDLTGYEWPDGSAHTVTITAYSNGTTYTESEPAQVSLVYEVQKYGVTFNFKDTTNTQIGSGFSAVASGVHRIGDIVPLDSIPDGYELENPDLEVSITTDYAMDVTVVLINAEPEVPDEPDVPEEPEEQPGEEGGGE